jgi:hypothetical protein
MTLLHMMLLRVFHCSMVPQPKKREKRMTTRTPLGMVLPLTRIMISVEIDLTTDASRKVLLKKEYKERWGEEHGYRSGTSNKDKGGETQVRDQVQNEEEGDNEDEEDGVNEDNDEDEEDNDNEDDNEDEDEYEYEYEDEDEDDNEDTDKTYTPLTMNRKRPPSLKKTCQRFL